MSCCGSKRQAASRALAQSGTPPMAAPMPPAGPRAAAPGALGVAYVYAGAGVASVVGQVSGRRYVFSSRGARLTVDARDAPAFDALPQFTRLRG